MLTKAILTGGVLSALAGCIVYFGTEGADAQIVDTRIEQRIADTELAGAPVPNVAEPEAIVSTTEMVVIDPPREKSKPKTNWLDRYLKPFKAQENPTTEEGEHKSAGLNGENVEAPVPEPKESLPMRIKNRFEGNGARSGAKGSYVVKNNTEEKNVDAPGLNRLNLFEDIDGKTLQEQLGLAGKDNVEIRVINKDGDRKSSRLKSREKIDYDRVLGEARKLLVTDMRNQAVLEIVDYAVDNGDMGQAADLVRELSTAALRDTARARIGTGLARQGNPVAAFAVLDEIEIGELSAPIRLEIITALVETERERKAFETRR